MKKFVTAAMLLSLPAFAYLPPDAGMIQVHDMQMIRQQKFRMEELNDYNDVQQEKERFQKKQQQTKPVVQKNFETKDSKFVDDNGEIKIEYTN